MTHRYYSEDTEQRKKYFDQQFFSKVGSLAIEINDFESFKTALKEAWKTDPSLESYFEGMSDKELREFFKRDKIQDIVTKKDEEKEEAVISLIEKAPTEIRQVKKKTRRFFTGEIKGKKVLVQKKFVKIKGKRRVRYRDSRGRFAKRI